MRLLYTETHLHLFGCLTVDEIWRRGHELLFRRSPDIAHMTAQRLDLWQTRLEHSDEAFAKTNQRFHWRDCWPAQESRAEEARARLGEIYLIKSPVSFARFDATLTLTAALFPATAEDSPSHTLEMLVRRHHAEGLRAAEYRVFTGHLGDPTPWETYLTAQARAAERFERETSGRFVPRLSVSVWHDPETILRQYSWIRAWQERHPELAHLITSLDICGPEEEAHPQLKASLIAHIHRENSRARHPVPLTIHVGETWERRPPEDALQWIAQLADLGVTRLGHASVLGIDPGVLARGSSTLPAEELALRQEQVIDHLLSLKLPPTIESCPTSNRRLGTALSEDLPPPAVKMLQRQLPVVIASDDPGIFETNLAEEESRCLTNAAMEPLLARAEVRARALLGLA
jgi:hypothetical protein